MKSRVIALATLAAAITAPSYAESPAASLGAAVSSGVVIYSIESSGPAAQANLRRMDVIETFDGQSVDSKEKFFSLVRAHRPGDVVTMTVVRADGSAADNVRRQTLQVSLQPLPLEAATPPSPVQTPPSPDVAQRNPPRTAPTPPQGPLWTEAFSYTQRCSRGDRYACTAYRNMVMYGVARQPDEPVELSLAQIDPELNQAIFGRYAILTQLCQAGRANACDRLEYLNEPSKSADWQVDNIYRPCHYYQDQRACQEGEVFRHRDLAEYRDVEQNKEKAKSLSPQAIQQLADLRRANEQRLAELTRGAPVAVASNQR